MKHTKTFVLIAAAAAAACAQPPSQPVAEARAALQKALDSEAAEYAPEELGRARDGIATLDAEIAAQEGRFAPLRSYEQTEKLAEAARAAGEGAVSAAVAGRESARQEASSTIEALRASIGEVRTLLAEAPTGKGTAADVAAMEAELAAVEGSVAELQQSLDAGRYREAALKGRTALETTTAIKTDIAAAVQARKAGRRRG